MNDQYQIPPPSSWEKFERMCADIFSIEWSDPSTQRNGRVGYPQNGVDVYGRTKDKRLHGIQCKKKTLETNNITTVNELREEVGRALTFQPPLSSFIFATTSPNDPALELEARKITAEHAEKGFFSVSFLGWDEIREKLWQHEHLVSRYYKWIIPGGDPNDYAFGIWNERFDSDYLFFNACYLPFKSSSVSFRPSFILELCSFINETDVLLDPQRTLGLDNTLKNSIDNFKAVASDIIDAAIIDQDRYDAEFDVYTYWVDIGNLDYYKKGDYIEYKKWVLKSLFYQLILASNYIIDVKNKLSQSLVPVNSFVKFQKYTRDAVIFPHYSTRDIDEKRFYIGINAVKNHIASQVDSPVLDYEKSLN